ncbi:hypothetical protein D9758_004018 [Tetrapyrgos nigripes]|uniref:SH3 domain-containing protein n=1 Tax=Tetrapyrgos nigripes TaxID=182062 RepID=A0A8H5GLV3_9AGAR|nr:hypothetical protein D9758_004018 [Tetrapyrgos nigripes]
MLSSFAEHIIAQTKANVELLIAHDHITPETGREILNRLPPAGHNPNLDPVKALTAQTQNLAVTAPEPTRAYSDPSSPAGNIVRAKALWDYNADGHDPNDLSFHAGDIIQIVHETNPDWWTGRYNGREGLFPSNYVEKVPPSVLPPKPPSRTPSGPPPNAPVNNGPTYPNYAPSYQPPAGPPAPMGYHSPPPGPPSYVSPPPPGGYGPPPNQVYNPYMNPPGAPPPQQAPPPTEEPSKKPSRFGGLGNTMAQSAAGGVGFGAGSAVGSGIINSIF